MEVGLHFRGATSISVIVLRVVRGALCALSFVFVFPPGTALFAAGPESDSSGPQTIYFAAKKSEASRSFDAIIKKNAAWILSKKGIRIELRGYTDKTADEKSSKGLANDRVNYVLKKLVAFGVPEDKISIVALGKEYPLGSDIAKETIAKQRRVEFIVLADPTAVAKEEAVTAAEIEKERTLTLARASFSLDDFKSAIALFATAARSAPLGLDDLTLVALSHLWLGSPKKSLAILLGLKPGNKDISLYLGMAYFEDKQFAKAIETLGTIPGHRDRERLVYLARSQYALKLIPDALATLTGMDVVTFTPVKQFYLGQIYFEQKDYQKARKYFEVVSVEGSNRSFATQADKYLAIIRDKSKRYFFFDGSVAPFYDSNIKLDSNTAATGKDATGLNATVGLSYKRRFGDHYELLAALGAYQDKYPEASKDNDFTLGTAGFTFARLSPSFIVKGRYQYGYSLLSFDTYSQSHTGGADLFYLISKRFALGNAITARQDRYKSFPFKDTLALGNTLSFYTFFRGGAVFALNGSYTINDAVNDTFDYSVISGGFSCEYPLIVEKLNLGIVASFESDGYKNIPPEALRTDTILTGGLNLKWMANSSLAFVLGGNYSQAASTSEFNSYAKYKASVSVQVKL